MSGWGGGGGKVCGYSNPDGSIFIFYPEIPRKPLLSLAQIISSMSDSTDSEEVNQKTQELWYGWNAQELWRAGLLYLGKGATVLIIGFIVFLYQSNNSFAVSMIFFSFGSVELLLGQWFYRQGRKMMAGR